MNANATEKANQETRDFQMQMYNRQRSDALADRDFNNQYNSPAAQMERLRAAGLNPNLAYGSGTVTSQAAQTRGADSGGYTARVAPKSMDLGGAMQGALNAIEMQKAQVQTDNIKAMTQLSQAETINKMLEQRGIIASSEGKELGNEQFRALMPPTIEGAYQGVAKTMTEMSVLQNRNEREAAMNAADLQTAAARITQMREQTANTVAERNNIRATYDNLVRSGILQDLDINLKKIGIQPNDAWYFRVLGQLLNPDSPAQKAWKKAVPQPPSDQDYSGPNPFGAGYDWK